MSWAHYMKICRHLGQGRPTKWIKQYYYLRGLVGHSLFRLELEVEDIESESPCRRRADRGVSALVTRFSVDLAPLRQ